MVDNEEITDIYQKYHATVNMSYSELLSWSKNPCSKKASLSRTPINRNLHLLSTKRENWKKKEINWANMTISFVSRMKENSNGMIVCDGLSKRQISLRNWAYRD